MAKVKVGDVVHLNSDPEVLFTVVCDLGKMSGFNFSGLFSIARNDKKKNNTLQMTVHEDSVMVVKS